MKRIWWWTQRHILRRWVCPKCGKELEKVIHVANTAWSAEWGQSPPSAEIREARACISRCGYREDA